MTDVDMCHRSSPGVPGSLGTTHGKAPKGRCMGQADPGTGVHVLLGQSWWQWCPGLAEHHKGGKGWLV